MSSAGSPVSGRTAPRRRRRLHATLHRGANLASIRDGHAVLAGAGGTSAGGGLGNRQGRRVRVRQWRAGHGGRGGENSGRNRSVCVTGQRDAAVTQITRTLREANRRWHQPGPARLPPRPLGHLRLRISLPCRPSRSLRITGGGLIVAGQSGGGGDAHAPSCEYLEIFTSGRRVCARCAGTPRPRPQPDSPQRRGEPSGDP